MRLHRLTLTAFGPFGGTQHIDFESLSAAGLFLFHGPTGAGKTSVLDAVCFALYGEVPGARHKSGALSLRSDHAAPGTPTEIVLDLTVAGRRLEITRRPEQERPKKRGTGTTRDRSRALLREHDPATGTWRALSHSQQEIGEELSQLLGMSCDQFCQVVLLPQGDFARFLRADAEERGKLLRRLFDTRRFRAAEEHLAKLRVRATQRLEAGDERLRATAHRLQQAAGPGTPPPPDAEEADADAVLAWAAEARRAARERHDSAAVALTTAEDAHGLARRREADTAERARLQRAHAEARARATALAGAAAERDATRALLERARAADAVAPALGLRDTAEAEHRAAADAERRARDLLAREPSGAPVDAPAARLAERERAARERLGALAAARRAEERAGQLTAELTRLDAEAAADEESAADTERRLAPWPEDHRRLRERVERARDAALTAARTARLLDPAERRLTAARRRDELAAALRTAEDEELRARERATEAHVHWLDLKERRLLGLAAELAAGLGPGEPCAVCGSPDHPRPARPAEGHVDRRAEEAALAAHQDAAATREATGRRLAALREAHATAAAAADDADGPAADGPAHAAADTARLAAKAAELRAAHAAAEAGAADGPAADAALAAAERRHESLLATRQDLQRRTAARASRRDALDTELAGLRHEIDRARDGAAAVAERAAGLTRLADALATAAATARAAEEAAARLKQADDTASDAAYRAGFDTPEAAARAVLDRARQRELQHRLDAWQAEEAAVAAALADPRATVAAALPAADPEAARAALDAATARLRAASAAEAAARTRRAELDALSAEAAADAAALAPLRAESRRVKRLADLTAGTSPENEYKMRLETYVLAARLEQVAAAAGVRLHRMSAGRYTLVHSDARTPGRLRSGLGLHVMDAWTGRARDTATLSGGESFFVSLALALGLADVVAEEAGGRRLDTLFIDEGFGSLDEQSLDEVLDVLDALREHDRSVAIVSHVPDLRARIPVQLEVVKTRRGSTVRHRTAPLSR
ncbi:AAA family ATPase [Streptomyces sp. NBC_01803]|uniref:AAA family ATPase n=1 Tax=Streptomyces sp. NBC_01803 TaxID=2975946 RepID=UPI002DDACB80|nr:AAA family ATPase [Streptomyces sp. NBC_01803]WSA47369.1 AAA family ATPase [Streptomyces sp. NBC_01803]